MGAIRGRKTECRACSLCTTRTQVVTGRGPLDSPILVIGGAPGWEDDQQNRIFSQDRLLAPFFAALGFAETEIRFTASVACYLSRPAPVSSDRVQESIAACRSWLAMEVDFMRKERLRQKMLPACPVLFGVGSIAMASLLPVSPGSPCADNSGHWWGGSEHFPSSPIFIVEELGPWIVPSAILEAAWQDAHRDFEAGLFDLSYLPRDLYEETDHAPNEPAHALLSAGGALLQHE